MTFSSKINFAILNLVRCSWHNYRFCITYVACVKHCTF